MNNIQRYMCLGFDSDIMAKKVVDYGLGMRRRGVGTWEENY
jgi:hypothetical protein